MLGRTPEVERRLTRGRAVASFVGGIALIAKGLYDLKQGAPTARALIGAGLLFIGIGFLMRRAGREPRRGG
jgi:hypothetical protein